MGKYGWHGDIDERGFDPDIASHEARFGRVSQPKPPERVEVEGHLYTVKPCAHCGGSFTSGTVQPGEEEDSGTKMWTCPCNYNINLMFYQDPDKE